MSVHTKIDDHPSMILDARHTAIIIICADGSISAIDGLKCKIDRGFPVVQSPTKSDAK